MAKKPLRHKILVPHDRTQRQPIVARCHNVKCLDDGEFFEFDVEHADVACPKCGATESPMLALLTLIHLLVPDERGPILGAAGRFKLLCDPMRPYLATETNLEAATDQLIAANCPVCLKAAEQQKLGAIQGVPVDHLKHILKDK